MGGTYRSLLAKDQQKSCQTKAEKAKDRCKALALLWKAFQQRHPHGSSSSTGSRYEKALQQTVDHYCKRRSSFCGMAKDLQARYKSAMAQGKLGTYRSLLAKDQQKSCQTKAEKAKDRCKALALLWKAFQQRHPHGTNPAATSLNKPASVQDFKISLKSLIVFVCKGAGDVTLLCQSTRGLARHFTTAVAQKKMSLFVMYSTRFQSQTCKNVKNSLRPKVHRVCAVLNLLSKRTPVL